MSETVRMLPRKNTVRCSTWASSMPRTSEMATEKTVMITVTSSDCHQYGELSTAA